MRQAWGACQLNVVRIDKTSLAKLDLQHVAAGLHYDLRQAGAGCNLQHPQGSI